MSDDKSNSSHLQATIDELTIVNGILDRICRVRETNHIMSIIIDDLIKATSASEGVINLAGPKDDLSLITIVRRSSQGPEDIPFQVTEQISGWVLTNQRQLIIDDLDSDERFAGLSSENGRFKSILCCPMQVRGEILGFTTLVRDSHLGPFAEGQSRLVGVVASQSGPILGNSILIRELAEKNELLELSQKKLASEYERLRSKSGNSADFENIVGQSAAIRQVLTLASKVSRNDSPVLITGPTGTGKEMIASAIHSNSARCKRPLVIKNCGVKTESLLESELFGHVKGAFTGALGNKHGLFKEADGGTIFLDEIGDAPLSTQAAILRVLESGEIRPIGASKTEFVDVRIISATNRNLKEAMRAGTFREDLFYRLNTFTIELPSLCERREDIPTLVHHFLKKVSIKLGIPELAITPAALELLSQHSWPGNIRQLAHEIERAAVVADYHHTIDSTHLSPEIISSVSDKVNVGNYRGQLRETVERVEREMIAATLERNNGNILRSSKDLGITRKGLKDKMVRYGLKSDEAAGTGL